MMLVPPWRMLRDALAGDPLAMEYVNYFSLGSWCALALVATVVVGYYFTLCCCWPRPLSESDNRFSWAMFGALVINVCGLLMVANSVALVTTPEPTELARNITNRTLVTVMAFVTVCIAHKAWLSRKSQLIEEERDGARGAVERAATEPAERDVRDNGSED